MHSLLLVAMFLTLSACVQDAGKIENGSVADNGSSTGSSSGGSSGGTSGGTPSDPLYQYQWHLKNTGQDVKSFVSTSLGIDSTPTPGVDLNVESVHDGGDGYTGAGVKIVVSDSGTDYTHPDLDKNYLPLVDRNYSFIDPARWDNSLADAYPSGNKPHGTAVAGIISMEGWNDIGGRGVAPGAQYTAYKFLLDTTALDHLASNLDKTLHQLTGSFDIFNYSYGYGQCEFINDYDDMIDAYKSEIATGRSGRGKIYVQSAGNSFEDGCYGNTNTAASLTLPYSIFTGAISADGVKSSYSTPGSGVWVSAFGGEGMVDIDPGVGEIIQYFPAIYTTDIQDCSSGFGFKNFIFELKNPFNYGYDRTLNPTCDYTNVMNGTSSAAPMVSGVVALMLEANPLLTWRDVKYILARTAVQNDYDFFDNVLVHPDQVTDLTPLVYDYKWSFNNSGIAFSNWYGFGQVDAEAAVAMAEAYPVGFLGTYQRTEDGSGNWDFEDSTLIPITDYDGITYTPSDAAAINVTTNLTIEAVQVRLSTDHPNPDQLMVILISPDGIESRLLLPQSGIQKTDGTQTDYYLLSNAFLDDSSLGIWTLRVYDTVTGDSGSITGWGINIHGH